MDTPPFQAQEVIHFLPLYAREFTSQGKHFALVLNCLNYGTQDQPNWAMDVQFLKQHEFCDELQLTPVRAYMVASWQAEKSNRSWVR